MKPRIRTAHMKAAQVYSELSYCKRRQVGCVIVKGDTVVAIGYNGTPAGEDNTCEDDSGATKPTVVHAEMNAIAKLDPEESCEDMIMFVTLSPCPNCAPQIIRRGFPEVNYLHQKRRHGLDILREAGVRVTQLQQE